MAQRSHHWFGQPNRASAPQVVSDFDTFTVRRAAVVHPRAGWMLWDGHTDAHWISPRHCLGDQNSDQFSYR